jgi:hypothetical protein
VRSVQALSTAEFVTAVGGLLIGLLMGLLLGAPLSNFPDPLGDWLPLATSIGFGLGMVGLTVAKRQDLICGRRGDRASSGGPSRRGGGYARAIRTSSSTPARSSTAGSPRS